MHENFKQSLLLLADISGYTNFMLANKSTLSKSSRVITELLHTVISQFDLHLSIAKIEGDAVFLYAVNNEETQWEELHMKLGEKLISFFNTFRDKITDLKNSVICEGDVCNTIEALAVKFIVHSGLTEEVEIGGFRELVGIDVIILHRLLKNSLKEKEYILLTESACTEMRFPGIICLDRSTDFYDGIGEVPYFVYHPSRQKPG